MAIMKSAAITKTAMATALVLAATASPTEPAEAAEATGQAEAGERAPFVIDDGVTQPVFSYDDAIRESVWVDLGTDLDDDGMPDRVAADIIRPSEPADEGQEIPVIMDVSPYFSCCGRGNEMQKKTYDDTGTPTGFPLFYDNYFVPRGYAVVLVDDLGTNRSTSCPDGGGPMSGHGARAVIDWLNGRNDAYSAVNGDDTVTADWAGGDVGMIGKSADGTVANAAATTGVDGLETVVGIGALSSYYEQYNSAGAWHGFEPLRSGPPGLLNPRQEELCEPFFQNLESQIGENGDFNRYWAQRDYTSKGHALDTSFFVIHGFADINVPSGHFGRWWETLTEHDVPRKAWLTQAGHVDPFDLRRADFVDTLHRWFDYWLLDIDNGVMDEPRVSIERSPGEWTDAPDWPAEGVATQTLWTHAGDTPGVGALTTSPADAGATETFVDDPELDRFAWAEEPGVASDARVTFRTEPLADDVHLSGTGQLTVTVESSEPEAVVSAALVDYGPATVYDYLNPKYGIVDLETRSCWGQSSSTDSACYLDTAIATQDVDHHIVASGSGDVGHWATLRHQLPLRPNRPYTITFDLTTMDHVVPAGHRLGVVLGGTDAFRIFAPSLEPTVTVDLSETSLDLPVADGSF